MAASGAPAILLWAEEQHWCKDELRLQCAHGLCADCCRRLLIEVGTEAAEREPLITKPGSPVKAPAELTEPDGEELEGYLPNGPPGACVFLDREQGLYTI